MNLAAIKIKNYKSFWETDRVALSDGLNIVTGQNNAGKTALLEAFQLNLVAAPHKSKASLPSRGEPSNVTSEIEFTVSVTGGELEQMSRLRQLQFNIPPNPGIGVGHPLGLSHLKEYLDPSSLEMIWQWLVDHEHIQFELRAIFTLSTSSSSPAPQFEAIKEPSHGLYSIRGTSAGSMSGLMRAPQPNGTVVYRAISGVLEDLGIQLIDEIGARIYRFSAERFNLGEAVFGTNKVLQPNAANLPEVLHVMQSENPAQYEKFLSLVRRVLPQLQWVSVVPMGSGQLQVRIWTLDKSSMRDDLAIPLTKSGTGIGQVLAILYVVFSSAESRVLLIDEPQSFLHPGAARKLIEVLKMFPTHQYIISTHSPSIIAAAHPKEILVLRNAEGRTSIEVVDAKGTDSLRIFLDEVGAKLSDVFGMDRVLWVEGPTEEKAFPLLVAKMGRSLSGTAIVSIRNTGDLEGKDAKKAFEIYRNLTAGAPVLPPAMAFVLDSEMRTDDEKREINTLAKDKARFLPRRTFENYLLHDAAIAATVNGIPGFANEGKSITEDEVGNWLGNALGDKKFWPSEDAPKEARRDDPNLNGAAVLAALFKEMSATRVSYRKTVHSVGIFKWILENDFDHLSELEEFLANVIDEPAD